MDETGLEHCGFHRGDAADMVDSVEHAKHRLDLSTILRRKVRTHTGTQIRRLPDVEDSPGDITEDIDAGGPG